MKKALIITFSGIAVLVITLLFIYDRGMYKRNLELSATNSSLSSSCDNLLSKTSSLEAEKEKISEDYSALQEEYDNLKSEAQPYLDLSKTERELFVETAKQAAKQKEEEIRKEEAQGYNTGITYEQISRYPDEYKGKKLKFSGRVLQIIEGETYSSFIRMSTKGAYDDVILASYSPSLVNGRLLEDDEVVIYGTAAGLYTYTTVMGSSITIPLVYVDIISLDGELNSDEETSQPTDPPATVSYPLLYSDNFVAVSFCGIEKNSGNDCVVFMVENKNSFAVEVWDSTVAFDGLDLGEMSGRGTISPNSKGKVYFYKDNQTNIDNKSPSTVGGSLIVNGTNYENLNGGIFHHISFSKSITS